MQKALLFKKKNHIQPQFRSLENFSRCNYKDSWNQVNKLLKINVSLSLLPCLPPCVKRQHACCNDNHILLPHVSALCHSEKSNSCTDDHSNKATGAVRKRLIVGAQCRRSADYLDKRIQISRE